MQTRKGDHRNSRNATNCHKSLKRERYGEFSRRYGLPGTHMNNFSSWTPPPPPVPAIGHQNLSVAVLSVAASAEIVNRPKLQLLVARNKGRIGSYLWIWQWISDSNAQTIRWDVILHAFVHIYKLYMTEEAELTSFQNHPESAVSPLVEGEKQNRNYKAFP